MELMLGKVGGEGAKLHVEVNDCTFPRQFLVPTILGIMDSAKIPLRGANRSTKVAGKLQVLPEGPTTTQEDNVQSPHLKLPPKKPGSEAADSQGTTGDSDDGDVDDDEEENLNADVEVRLAETASWIIQLNILR